MKALVKSKAEPGIWMKDVPMPKMGHTDVLIRIQKTSICGTDMHIYQWDEWAQQVIPVPMTVGHEYSGIIEKIGEHVTEDLKVGQRVSGEGHIVGKRSRNVRAGRFHLDPETQGVGVNRPGAFAEYLVIPAFNVVPLPEHVPQDIGAILDPFGNAVHTALSFNLLGEDVLITGAGPIGTMAAAVAKFAGARHVVLTDINSFRLELAQKVVNGIHIVNVAEDDLQSVMNDLNMREGFDIGLEMSGSPAAFEQMVNNMIMGGKIGMLGIPHGSTQVNWSKIIFKALTIKGVYGREMFETWYKMFALIEGGLDLTPIITHQYTIDDFQNGFDVMESGKAGKVILNWE
ncbi:MAG: L-threonine 3-dehydrogenase [Aggregatilineales bacterium]